jgi:hypothetical protein
MYAILLPSGAGIMVFESVYTRFTRVTFFGMGGVSVQTATVRAQTTGSEH